MSHVEKLPTRPRLERIRINVDELYDVRHWAKALGLTEAQLRFAVGEVGPLVDSVKHYLEGQSSGPVRETT